ncbi:MAG TPA: hypothetical protein VGD65_06205 [Chryseosolibacter sp.]
MAKRNLTGAKKVVFNALKSGVVDPKISLESMVSKFEGNIDEVAGYVAAWDRYVLVVAQDAEILENNPLENRISALEQKIK